MNSKSQATADVFFRAFKALAKQERDAVLVRIVNNRSLRQDLLDLATVAQRAREPSRPFRKFLEVRRSK